MNSVVQRQAICVLPTHFSQPSCQAIEDSVLGQHTQRDRDQIE